MKSNSCICPICGKPIQDYHSQDVICPACNTDLSIYRTIDDIPENKSWKGWLYMAIVAFVATIAVAIILIAGIFFMNADKAPEVYVGTERLTEEVHITEAESGSLMLARMNNEIMCEFTIDLKTETEVFTSWGALYSENGEILADNNKTGMFSGELKCKWVVPMPDASFTYLIALRDKSGDHYIKLYYDDEVSQWTTCFSDTVK